MARRNRYRTERNDEYNRGDFRRNRERNYPNYRSGEENFDEFESDRDENYFGGGNLSYGRGYTGGSNDRDYNSFDNNYDRGYSSTGGEYSRDFIDRGYGRRQGNREFSGELARERNFSDRGFSGRQNFRNERWRERGERDFRSYGPYDRGYARDDNRYDQNYYQDRSWLDKAADEVSSWFGDEQAERRRRMDARQGNRGRGPSGYTRSDDRIREEIHDQLTDDYFLDATNINVEVSNGEVVLTGNVNSRFAKRHAEDIVEDVSGVTHCENRLRVTEDRDSRSDASYRAVANENDEDTSSMSRSKTA